MSQVGNSSYSELMCYNSQPYPEISTSQVPSPSYLLSTFSSVELMTYPQLITQSYLDSALGPVLSSLCQDEPKEDACLNFNEQSKSTPGLEIIENVKLCR